MPKTMTYTDPQHSLVPDLGQDYANGVAASKKRKRAEDQQVQNSTKRPSMSSNQLAAAMGSLNEALHNRIMSNGSNNYNQMNQGQSASQNDIGSNDATSTAAAALAANGLGQPGDMSFMSTGSGTDGDQVGSSFDMGMGANGQTQHAGPYSLQSFTSQPTTTVQVQAARDAMHGNGTKPVVGSEEWHKVRKDNHKEGESPINTKLFVHRAVGYCVLPICYSPHASARIAGYQILVQVARFMISFTVTMFYNSHLVLLL